MKDSQENRESLGSSCCGNSNSSSFRADYSLSFFTMENCAGPVWPLPQDPEAVKRALSSINDSAAAPVNSVIDSVAFPVAAVDDDDSGTG